MDTVLNTPPMEKKIYYKCSKCEFVMESEDTWLRLISKENPEDCYVYCRPCVEKTPELQEQSDYMCRYLVMELLRKSTDEERAEMKELMKKERPEDFDLIADLFDVKPFIIESIREVPAGEVVADASAVVPPPAEVASE